MSEDITRTASGLDALTGLTQELVTPDPKPWWRSKGMWGSVAAALVGTLGLARWGIDAGSVAELLSALATLIAGVLAARGRATAQQPIAHGLLPKRTRYLPRGGD